MLTFVHPRVGQGWAFKTFKQGLHITKQSWTKKLSHLTLPWVDSEKERNVYKEMLWSPVVWKWNQWLSLYACIGYGVFWHEHYGTSSIGIGVFYHEHYGTTFVKASLMVW